MVLAKVWVIGTKLDGMPKLSDFKCVEEEVPPCQDNEVIIEAICWSVDPYMRYRIRASEVGSVIAGSQVAKVIESNNQNYPVGCYVLAYPGWRTHTKLSKEDLSYSFDSTDKLPNKFPIDKLPDFGTLPKSYALGLLGMPGNTAYFGFLEICKPKAGETVVVNAAGGAVGSLVCQIAKIKGCHVIGFVGSDAKVAWLTDNGCVDAAFNYKKIKVFEVLKSAATNGIDCYFDNVGGSFTAEVLPHMNNFGRISICGCISTYNDESKTISDPSLTSPFNEAIILWKQLKIEGFIVIRWLDRWMEGISQMQQWLQEGKLKYNETITKGFENMPEAFIGLFTGENMGKAIVSK